jgi:multimeric flavodoxin WrbA
MRVLVLSSSPRRDGNSAALARAAAGGLQEAGHRAELVFAPDILGGFLRDCRTCRNARGECTIEDGFAETFLQRYLPAEGFIAATPIYWYGMSAQLKTFFDRMFCNVAASSPRSAQVVAQMQGKRLGLLLSSEETFPTVTTALIHQFQEFARYTASTFVGMVHGVGNARGDVVRDPARPVDQARRLGRNLFSQHAADYRIDTPRAGRVWA